MPRLEVARPAAVRELDAEAELLVAARRPALELRHQPARVDRRIGVHAQPQSQREPGRVGDDVEQRERELLGAGEEFANRHCDPELVLGRRHPGGRTVGGGPLRRRG